MIVWYLATVMASRNIDSKALASKIGKHPNTIRAWRKSETLPSIGGETLWILIEALNALSPDGAKRIGLLDLIREDI